MRREDWKERLWATLEGEAARRQFFYGACVALAAECIDATTGSHYRADVQPLIEAARDGRITLETLEAFVTERLGPPVPLHLADQGDLVLLDLEHGGGPTIGVCTGPYIACPGERGVVYLRRERGLRAWKI